MNPIQKPLRAGDPARVVSAALALCSVWLAGCEDPHKLQYMETVANVWTTRKALSDPKLAPEQVGAQAQVQFTLGGPITEAEMKEILAATTVTFEGERLHPQPMHEEAILFMYDAPDPIPLRDEGYVITIEHDDEVRTYTAKPVSSATISAPTEGSLVPVGAPLHVEWTNEATGLEMDALRLKSTRNTSWASNLHSVKEHTFLVPSLVRVAGMGTEDVPAIVGLSRSRLEHVEGGMLITNEDLDLVSITITP